MQLLEKYTTKAALQKNVKANENGPRGGCYLCGGPHYQSQCPRLGRAQSGQVKSLSALTESVPNNAVVLKHSYQILREEYGDDKGSGAETEEIVSVTHKDLLANKSLPAQSYDSFDGNSKELTSKEVGIVRFREKARYDKVGSDYRNDKKFNKEAHGPECNNMRNRYQESWKVATKILK